MKSLNLKSKLNLLDARPLRHLFFARSLSTLGDMLIPVALAFAVLDFADSASALGIILAARAIPSVLLMLLGGVAGDRYSRRKIMVISNMIGFLAQASIGYLLITNEASVWSIAVLTAIRGLTSSFFNPASTGAIAQAAPNPRKQEAFALFAIAGNIAEVGGPILAGIALTIINPGWLLLVDALTFLISAVLIATSGPLGESEYRKSKTQKVSKEISEGLIYVLKNKWLTVLIVSASLFQFFLLSSLNVLGPLVASEQMGGAPDWALIVAALGAGSIVGSIIAMFYKPNRPLLVGYSLLLLGAGPTLFLLAIPAPLPLIVISEFISGMTISFFATLESTSIARIVPTHLLSRVDSVNRLGSMALRPIGLAIIAPIAVVIGVSTTLVISATITLLAVIVPLTISSVRNLRLDEETEDSKISTASKSG